jgi:dolichol-phosphate mannosyltransferase
MSEKISESDKFNKAASSTVKPVLSIVIPTYNERDNITSLMQNLSRVLSAYDYEIVVVDDNSRDGTIELLNSLSHDYPIKLIVRKDKRGLATAVVDGFAHSSGSYISVMDADLQHPPELLLKLLEQTQKGADIAVASRYVKGGGCEGWSFTRKLISRGAMFLAHLLLPPTRRTHDPMSGYFMFNQAVLNGTELKPQGYKILMELLMAGKYNQVVDVPYQFRTRQFGESKLNARQQFDYLKHIYSLMRRSGELLRFVKFLIVGISGIVVNEGLLWLLKENTGMPLLVASAIAIETSIITNFIFNDYFTFRDRRERSVNSSAGRFFKFNLVSLAGLAINLSILWLLTTYAGEQYYLIWNLFGIACATMWNYLLNLWWTWK